MKFLSKELLISDFIFFCGDDTKLKYNVIILQMEMRLPLEKLDIIPPHFLTDDNKEMYKEREEFLVNYITSNLSIIL